MNKDHTALWRGWLGRTALVAGLALLALGAPSGSAEAAMAVPAPMAAQAPSAALQPVYWARDRFGRRVWVEEHYRRPPPRYHHRRHGWVDRYGRWHPYR